MPVHALLEYTARDEAVGELAEAARAFATASREREDRVSRHEVFRIDGSRTFLHLISFDDALAAEEHRTAKHTRAFTETLDELGEGDPELHELDAVDGFRRR